MGYHNTGASNTAPVIWPSNAAPPTPTQRSPWTMQNRLHRRTGEDWGASGERPLLQYFVQAKQVPSRGPGLLSALLKASPRPGDQTSCPMTELWVQRWVGVGGLEARFKAGHVGGGAGREQRGENEGGARRKRRPRASKGLSLGSTWG